MDTPVVTPGPPEPARKKGFGDILGSALGGFARGAAGPLAVLSPPAALVGGLVSGVASAVSALTRGGGGSAPIRSDADLLALLSQPGELSSQDYLRIQQYMQAEAQQFTAVSNILKVRSDSAKAAINNIRSPWRSSASEQQASSPHRRRPGAFLPSDSSSGREKPQPVPWNGWRSSLARWAVRTRRGSSRGHGWAGSQQHRRAWTASSRSPRPGELSLPPSSSRSRQVWPRRARRWTSPARCWIGSAVG